MRAAYDAAARRFTGLLDELCEELTELRRAADPAQCALQGVVARRMHAAVAPFAADHFITPMAAVAGSVAEEILGAMLGAARARSRLCQQWRRHRAASGRGEHFTVGLMDRPDRHGVMRTMIDRCRRSRRAASRPAAATAAVFRSALPTPSRCWREPHRRPTPPPPSSPMRSICPGIPPSSAVPANELQPDSDLGARLVTRDVGAIVAIARSRTRWKPALVVRGRCSPRD